MDEQDKLLDVKELTARYGNVQALHPTSFHLNRGEFVAVLGPNGAGKSTLMRATMGLVDNSGSVEFLGQKTKRNSPANLASQGIILVPEGRGIFSPMTVLENLELGGYLLGSRSRVAAERLSKVLDLFPRLKERLDQVAGSLSGGEQQMLAVGRALMAGPKLLLLDEPSLGLAPRVIGEILEALGQLNREGLSIMLVEQKAPLALQLASRVYILSLGRVVAEIDPREIKSHDELAHYYFA